MESAQTKKTVLRIESSVLKKMNSMLSTRPHHYFCGFKASGTSTNHHNKDEVITYLVMSLAGSKYLYSDFSLSDLRKQQPQGKFDTATTALLGKQMIESIEQIHAIGYLHRDIKPANFCVDTIIKPNEYRPRILLIDFGLSRRFLCTNNTIRPVPIIDLGSR